MGRWLEYRRNGSSGNWRSGNLATVSQARGELWAEVRPCEIQQSEGTEEQSRSEPLADPVGQVWPEPVGPSPTTSGDRVVKFHFARSLVPVELALSTQLIAVPITIL